MAKNPQKLTRSKTYIQHLNAAGLSDAKVSELTRGLATSLRREKEYFPDVMTETIEDEIVENEEGVKEKRKTTVFAYKKTPVKDIKKIIEATPGCTLIKVLYDSREHRQIAYCNVPDGTQRKNGLELVHKSKGLFAPSQLEVFEPPEATPEDEEIFLSIKKQNK